MDRGECQRQQWPYSCKGSIIFFDRLKFFELTVDDVQFSGVFQNSGQRESEVGVDGSRVQRCDDAFLAK